MNNGSVFAQIPLYNLDSLKVTEWIQKLFENEDIRGSVSSVCLLEFFLKLIIRISSTHFKETTTGKRQLHFILFAQTPEAGRCHVAKFTALRNI